MKKNYTLKFLLMTLFTLFLVVNINAQVRIVEVVPSTNEITYHNYGSSTVDISSLWLCNFPDYANISGSTLNLAAGAEVTVVSTVNPLSAADGEIAIYNTNSFSSSTAMEDYVQWGSGGHQREVVAVNKGIWTAGTFIPANDGYSYTGDGAQNGAPFWTGFTLSNPEFQAKTTKFSIYPNPSSYTLNIDVPTLSDEGLKLEVFDVLGKKVLQQNINTLKSSVNISKWNSGLYLVRLTSPDGDITLTKRFVKN